MTQQDWSSWASVPWTRVTGTKDQDDGDTIGFQKKTVPYIPGGVSQQTLDIWIPGSAGDSSGPNSTDLPKRPGHWLVFIHGGAWHDPMLDSSCLDAAALNILRSIASSPGSTGIPEIAGLASLNYRLSPYPDHPTDPSPPADPGAAPDPGRLAKHPDHIQDILSGLAFLQRLGGATRGYALAGHSCGATLAFQAVMDPSRWGLKTVITKPAVIVGVNGLYNLAGFIANPPPNYGGELRDAYVDFTRLAFGDKESVWEAVCPASATPWPQEWKEGTRVVLVESRQDTLVPYEQLEEMRSYLRANSSLEVQELEATGGHDSIWVKGDRLAEIFCEVLSGLGREAVQS